MFQKGFLLLSSTKRSPFNKNAYSIQRLYRSVYSTYLELFDGSETVVESAATFAAGVELLAALPFPAEPLLPLPPAFADDAPAVEDDAN